MHICTEERKRGMAPSHSVTETDKQSFVSLKGGHARDLDNEIIKGERDRRWNIHSLSKTRLACRALRHEDIRLTYAPRWEGNLLSGGG